MKFLLAGLVALYVTPIAAVPMFIRIIPGASHVPGIRAIGHNNPQGSGSRNAFGNDFRSAGFQWTEEFCYTDSDHDGQFNGAELGDPCCEWVLVTNEKLAYTTATAPGDPKSKQDPQIWASIKCADGLSPDAKYKAYLGKDEDDDDDDAEVY